MYSSWNLGAWHLLVAPVSNLQKFFLQIFIFHQFAKDLSCKSFPLYDVTFENCVPKCWTLISLSCSSRHSVYPTTQPSQEPISLITPPTTPFPQPEEKKTTRQRAKPVRTAKGTRRSTRLLGERKWDYDIMILNCFNCTFNCSIMYMTQYKLSLIPRLFIKNGLGTRLV